MSAIVTGAPAVRRRRRSFRTSGTWIVPDDVWLLEALLISGGGGGGGGTSSACGGGGGSGWPVRFIIPVSPGDTVAVVIGAGGVGGDPSTGPGQGGDGGASTISVNGVVVALVPGGGGGGLGGGTQPVNAGRPSWGLPGAAYYTSSSPNSGGGGAGYSGGLSGIQYSVVRQVYVGAQGSGVDRIRNGRPFQPQHGAPDRVGGTNGLIPVLDKQSAAGWPTYEPALWIPERFPALCWGGTLTVAAGDISGSVNTYPATAQPANTGHGGTGAGGHGNSVAANLAGGTGGSGLALMEWEAAA